ncbi:MAG: hypothetical protein HY070_09545 [Chloroflexi bacterium]|nr:hypothetical protein [Chloroflexota bacterium]
MSFAELVLRFALALIVLISPGAALAWRFLRALAAPERFVLALAAGLAIAIYANFVLTLVNLNLASIAFVAAFGFCLLYLLAAFVKTKSRFSLRALSSYGWLVAIVSGAIILRLYPLYVSEYPGGADTVFHLILARKITLNGILPTDWTPFETIAVNYTLGGHAFIAQISELAGIPLHRAFALIMVALAGMSTALVYVIGKNFFGRDSLARASAFAYAFIANLGSLDYYRWGGLPNETAMTLLLAAFALLWCARDRASGIFAAITFASIYFVHHHSMLVVFLLAASIVGALWFTAQRDDARRFAAIFALSLAIASFWLVPYALRIGKLSETLITGFWIFFVRPWEIPTELGIVFTLLIIPGLIALARDWSRWRATRVLIWGVWTGVLLAAFFFLEYVYRALTKLLTGNAVTVFTPEHFLTDAVYPLAFAAGWTLERAAEYFTRRFGARGKILIATGAAALIIGVGGMIVSGQARVVIQPDEIALYDWIRAQTAPNAMFLENPMWLEYVTWREGSLTPLPVTEPVNDPSVVFKENILKRRNWVEIAAWQKRTARPLYFITQNEELNQAGWSQVFFAGQWRVYQFSN